MDKFIKSIQQFLSSRNATVALVILLFLSVSYLSYGLYLRMDLSSQGTLRLTKTTRQILNKLEEPLTIEAYFSEDMPEAALQTVKFMKDFVSEYAGISSKVRLRVLNPDKDEDAKMRADSLGIRPLQIGAVDKKKQEVASIYFSLALHYGGKTEIVPSLLESPSPEYDITARVIKLSQPERNRVGILVNPGMVRPDSNANSFEKVEYLRDTIETLYGAMEQIDTTVSEIPPEVKTILLVRPGVLTEIDRYKLDQFLMRGGRLIVAASGMAIDFQSGIASESTSDIVSFLEPYGIVLGKDMIYESNSNFLPYEQRVNAFQSISLPYPVWNISTSLNQKLEITKGLKALVLPYASTITLAGKQEGTTAEILASSSSGAWAQKSFAMIDPRRMPTQPPEGTTKQIHNQSVLLSGKFKSAFAASPDQNSAYPHLPEGEGKLLVTGTPYAFTDIGVQLSDGLNLNFVLSAVDSFNGMEELLALRKKSPPAPKRLNLSQATQDAITFFNFLIPLGLLAGFGIYHFSQRRQRMNQGENHEN